MPAERRFRAMGSQAHLVVNGGPSELPDRAERRLAELERRWSRFLPDSELCQVNAAAGRAVRVGGDTTRIVQRAVEAWQVTGGLFDPTVLGAVESAGYDRTFEQVRASDDAASQVAEPEESPAVPAPGCGGIEVGEESVRLPAGVRLDLGGIGKGYAADQVAYELRSSGADGVCVNLGGDVRVSGPYVGGSSWSIGVGDPFDGDADLTTVALAEGAVATSSRLQRRWKRGGQERHHLIDPRTGRPSQSTLVAVTVVAAQAHWAEILAKAALVAGEERGTELLEAHGLSALLVRADRTVVRVGSIKEYEAWTRSSGGTSPAPAV